LLLGVGEPLSEGEDLPHVEVGRIAAATIATTRGRSGPVSRGTNHHARHWDALADGGRWFNFSAFGTHNAYSPPADGKKIAVRPNKRLICGKKVATLAVW